MRISYWSSDVCSSDLGGALARVLRGAGRARPLPDPLDADPRLRRAVPAPGAGRDPGVSAAGQPSPGGGVTPPRPRSGRHPVEAGRPLAPARDDDRRPTGVPYLPACRSTPPTAVAPRH